MFAKIPHHQEHSICRDCMHAYMRFEIAKQQAVVIECPEEKCKAYLNYEEIRELAARADFELFNPLYPLTLAGNS